MSFWESVWFWMAKELAGLMLGLGALVAFIVLVVVLLGFAAVSDWFRRK